MAGDDGGWFDETEAELHDHEFPDDELSETVPCPQCGAEVYEDCVQCPACGTYVTHDTNLGSGRPMLWIVLGLLGIVAAVLVLAGLSVY